VGAHPLEATDQHAETGGVEELHALDIDDEVVVARVDQADEGLAQLGCGVDIDLTGHRDHGVRTLGAGVQ
jgi:hypothetical protein